MARLIVIVTAAFAYAHGGHRVVQYAAGKQELDDEVAECAIKNGWAKPLKRTAPAASELAAADPAETDSAATDSDAATADASGEEPGESAEAPPKGSGKGKPKPKQK